MMPSFPYKSSPSSLSPCTPIVVIRPDIDPCDGPHSPPTARNSVSPPLPNWRRLARPSASAVAPAYTRTTAAGVDAADTSSHILAPTVFTISSHISFLPNDTESSVSKPDPICIPRPTLQPRDINRIPTPLSARGDRKGHLFPYSRTPSPPSSLSISSTSPETFQPYLVRDNDQSSGRRLERARPNSVLSPYSSIYNTNTISNMHAEQYGSRYPTSPLSPKLPSPNSQSLSQQVNTRRGNHGRQASRNMHLSMPMPGRFHPSNFPQADVRAATPTSAVQSPAILLNRVTQPVQMETPRLMRQKQREFIEKAHLSSKLAASPMSIKPDAPRLDPLGSPKGAVTPLMLEEPGDYFQVASSGKHSPAASPGARSRRNSSDSSSDEANPKKSRKVDIYH